MKLFLAIFAILVSMRAHAQECREFMAAEPSLVSYAKALATQLAGVSTKKAQLEILLSAIHKADPLGRNRLNLGTVEKIFEKHGTELIRSDAELASEVGSDERTMIPLYREIHNRYGRFGLAQVFFGPTAEDVFRFKFAFGCSHYARALGALIRAAKVLPAADVRYVAAVSTVDQKKICASADEMANGHQFLRVRLGREWFYLNASSSVLELVRAKENDDWKNKNEIVVFPSLSAMPGGGEVAIRAVEEVGHPVCDGSLEALRNIYRSGNPSDVSCRWPALD